MTMFAHQPLKCLHKPHTDSCMKSVAVQIPSQVMWLDSGRNPVKSSVEISQPFTLTMPKAPLAPDRLRLKSPSSQSYYHTSTCPLAPQTPTTHTPTHRRDSRPGDHTDTPHIQYLVIHGLLHEQRIRHIHRDRADQDRRQCLPWNRRRPVENRVQLRQLGLATGGWPTVRGGRKGGREDRRGLSAVSHLVDDHPDYDTNKCCS